MHILIIDKHRHLAEALATTLSHLHQIEANVYDPVHNTALTWLYRELQPNLVLVDLVQPEGLQHVQSILTIDQMAKVAGMALECSKQQQGELKGMKAKGYFSKLAELDIIAQIIKKMVSGIEHWPLDE